MSDHAKSVIPGNADVSIYDIMARCALNEEDETELMRYTQSKARPRARAFPNATLGGAPQAERPGSGAGPACLLFHSRQISWPLIFSPPPHFTRTPGSQGMMFISTPFSRAAAYRLERMGVQARLCPPLPGAPAVMPPENPACTAG